MKRMLYYCLTAAACLVATLSPQTMRTVSAQTGMENEPAVVISIASIQEQLNDIGYLLKRSGFGQFSGLINLQAKEFLKGIDLEKPIGVMLTFGEDSGAPHVLAFVPVTNLQDFLNVVSPYADVQENGDVTTITADDGTEFVIKEQNGIMFVSNDAEQLKQLPSDPVKSLMELPAKYNFAARVFGQRIPKNLRDTALGFIREGMEQQLDQMPPGMADIQKMNIQYQMNQMESLINETDEVKLGFAINADSASLYFDVDLVGEKGSKIAQQVAANTNLKPRFAGFVLKDSAFNATSCSRVVQEDAEQGEKMLSEFGDTILKEIDSAGDMTAEEADAVKSLIRTFFDSLAKTVQEGNIDFGLVGKMDEDVFNAAMAIGMADGMNLQDELKKVLPLVEKRAGDKLTVKFDAQKNATATFHELEIAVPENEPQARKVFGDHISVNLGFAKDAAYFTFGEGGIDLLSEALENSKSAAPQDSPMSQFNVYLAPVFRFAASASGDETAKKLADKITESGNDRISVVTRQIDNGITMRFEMEDGFLTLIGMAAQFGGGFGGNEF